MLYKAALDLTYEYTKRIIIKTQKWYLTYERGMLAESIVYRIEKNHQDIKIIYIGHRGTYNI